ncbi:MAG TPA: hypothetical protein VLI90_07410, partial [Tepidisphaeraceae bacterium]|nr:hypothetical protein [Tepidisphaeraceae bacterium]
MDGRHGWFGSGESRAIIEGDFEHQRLSKPRITLTPTLSRRTGRGGKSHIRSPTSLALENSTANATIALQFKWVGGNLRIAVRLHFGVRFTWKQIMKLTRVGNAVDRLGIALGKKRKLRMLLDPDMPSLTQRPTAEGLECRLLFAIAVPTALTTFDGITDGAPQVGVTVSGDTIYGTTPIGGQNDDGAVYSMPITGGTPDLISGFNGTNGHQPMGDLLLVNNTLYGTTSAGGANN